MPTYATEYGASGSASEGPEARPPASEETTEKEKEKEKEKKGADGGKEKKSMFGRGMAFLKDLAGTHFTCFIGTKDKEKGEKERGGKNRCLGGVLEGSRRYAVYLLYWYKSTNTD
jgi:hypothetical protein